MTDAQAKADTRAEINALDLRSDRPLIISDADEVLLVFMAAFVDHLATRDLWFDWADFRLTGNVRRRSDNEPIAASEVADLLQFFYSGHAGSLDAVPGAADALSALKAQADIVILTNLPRTQADARRRSLAGHGMPYPVVINTGPKGPAVEEISAGLARPVFFLDDSPRHHASVAEHAPSVQRLHFVHDPRLRTLVGPAEAAHHRVDTWPEARVLIETHMASKV